MRPRWTSTVILFGTRLPFLLAALIGTTLVASIIGAVGWRNGVPLLNAGILIPEQVGRAQLWRLVTWVLFDTNPLSLIFSLLMLWWLGREFCMAWGPQRFLAIYFTFAVGAAVITCLVALLWAEIRPLPYLTAWPVIDALLIAWGARYPHRQILAYMVVPISGRRLIALTFGVTVLFALLNGAALYVPHLAAQMAMLLFVGDFSPRALWSRFRPHRSSRMRPPFRVVSRDRDEPPRWLH